LSDTEKQVHLVQLSCETDFVARTKEFNDSIRILMKTLEEYPKDEITNKNLDEILKGKLQGELPEKYAKKTVNEMLALLSSNTLENCDLNNLFKRVNKPGIIIGTYLHGEVNGTNPKIGTRAGIVICESESQDLAGVKKLANSIALQVAAMKPMYKDKESLPSEIAKTKGKDQAFLEENVLLEQEYIIGDDKKKVREVIIQKQYELRARVNIKEFYYFDHKQ